MRAHPFVFLRGLPAMTSRLDASALLRSALVGMLVAVVQVLAVFNPRVVEVDHEEMFNAGQAWALLNGHALDLFRLQYREFCGGCTADALLAVPLFATLGPRWLVWKLVPIAYAVAAAVLGHRVLSRRVGPAAGWALVALFVLPPRTWLHLSLIGWGNHYEAGMVGVCGLLLVADALADHRASAGRWIAAGLALGGAVWIGFSGAFGVVAAGLCLLAMRRWRPLAWLSAGVALGLSPWLAQYLSAGQHPFVTIYEEGESVPLLTRIPHKLGTLLYPRQLAALFGHPSPGLGHAAGWLWAGAAAVASGLAVRFGRTPGRVMGAGLAVWTGIYLLVRFQVAEPPPPALAVPGSCRYAAPLFPLLFVLLAVGVGTLWHRGRQAVAGALLAGPLVVGLFTRIETVQAPFPAPSAWTMHAVDWPYFRHQFSYVVDMEKHRSPTTDDPFSLGAHAYGAARETASALLRDDRYRDLQTLPERPTSLPLRGWWQGVGDALGSFHQNRLEGTLAILRTSQRLLDTTPGADADARQRALRSVAAWQMHAPDIWIRSIDRHDAGTFKAVHAALDVEAAELADAGWWAVGFTWAHHVVGWHQPVKLHLPEDPAGLPPAFVEGFAHALAEEWGPLDRLEHPRGLPKDGVTQAAFARGWADGLVDRWLGEPRVPVLR